MTPKALEIKRKIDFKPAKVSHPPSFGMKMTNEKFFVRTKVNFHEHETARFFCI